jgi:hypothetical protein
MIFPPAETARPRPGKMAASERSSFLLKATGVLYFGLSIMPYAGPLAKALANAKWSRQRQEVNHSLKPGVPRGLFGSRSL